MDDEAKTKAELIDEVRALRRRLTATGAGATVGPPEPSARRSAHLFARAFKVNPAAITITRFADGHILDVNDKFVELLGYSPEEAIGRTSQDLGLWVDPEERLRLGRLLLEHGTVREVGVQFRAKRGHVLDGRTALAFIDIDDEQCVLTVVQDVTEQRWTEQTQRFLIEASTALAASLDRETILADFVRLAVSHLADWCAVDAWDENGAIRRWSSDLAGSARHGRCRQVEQRTLVLTDAPFGPPNVLRTGQSEIAPELVEEFLHAIAQTREDDSLLRGLDARSAIVVPLTARGRTLGAVTFVTGGSGRRYRQGDLVLAEDLARRAALAVDNALLYREAQQALQAREAFFSIAAHELKTPTTVILAHAELLERRAEREGTTSERNLRALRTLSGQADRLSRLIEAVLDVSRLQGGELRLERDAVDLAGLVRRVAEELSLVAGHHTLVCVTPPDPQIIEGDALRLEQVLQNLVQNAVKYSPHGSTIRVQIEQRNAEVAVSVADQGVGVPEAAIPELFRPFYRASNIDSWVTGFGIGLYVVKEIVTRHGGSVHVASAEGQGSTFTIMLPLRLAQEEHP